MNSVFCYEVGRPVSEAEYGLTAISGLCAFFIHASHFASNGRISSSFFHRFHKFFPLSLREFLLVQISILRTMPKINKKPYTRHGKHFLKEF